MGRLFNQKAQVKQNVDQFLYLCAGGASCNSAWFSRKGKHGEGAGTEIECLVAVEISSEEDN